MASNTSDTDDDRETDRTLSSARGPVINPLSGRTTAASTRTQRRNATGGGIPIREWYGRGFGGGSQKQLQLYDAVGYPDERDLTFSAYYERYLRQGVGAGLLDKLVRDTWQHLPEVTDDENTGGDDDEDETDFEAAVSDFFANAGDADLRMPPHAVLLTLDTLATLGEYAVLVCGFTDDDDISDPVGGGATDDGGAGSDTDTDTGTDSETDIATTDTHPADGLDDLAFLEVYHEDGLNPREDRDLNSARYGRVEAYRLTDPHHDVREIHHTRTIHVTEHPLADPLHGEPFFQNIINRLVDLDKIHAASGEGYWRGGYQGLVASPPMGSDGTLAYGLDNLDSSGLAEQIGEYRNNMRRFIATTAQIDSLGTQIASPTAHLGGNYAAIAAAKDVPQSIVKGNETGERATVEDSAQYRSRIAGRRDHYAETAIIRPLIDLFIWVGIFPEPDGGPGAYTVEWPPLHTLSDRDKAEIASTWAAAFATLSSAANLPGPAIGTPAEARVDILDWGPERGSEAPESMAAQDHQALTDGMASALDATAGTGTNADGTGTSATATDGGTGMGDASIVSGHHRMQRDTQRSNAAEDDTDDAEDDNAE